MIQQLYQIRIIFSPTFVLFTQTSALDTYLVLFIFVCLYLFCSSVVTCVGFQEEENTNVCGHSAMFECRFFLYCHLWKRLFYFKRPCPLSQIFFLKDSIYSRQRGREREREGEKHQCVRDTWLPLTHTPCWGPGLQPRHVPWLGIEPATFGSCAGAQSTEPHQPGQVLKHFHLLIFDR